jgi:hypothetical protein
MEELRHSLHSGKNKAQYIHTEISTESEDKEKIASINKHRKEEKKETEFFLKQFQSIYPHNLLDRGPYNASHSAFGRSAPRSEGTPS